MYGVPNLYSNNTSPDLNEQLRAVAQKVSSLKKSGVTDPKQIAQVMQGEININGQSPLALYSMLLEMQRNAAPTQPPPAPSVAVQAAKKVLATASEQERPGLNIQQIQAALQPPPPPQGMPPQGMPPQMMPPQMMPPQGMPPQGMPPQGMPPQGPIAHGRHGGLADLPAHNIGNPEHYAGGGIVAFDDGGEIKHYKSGRTVNSNINSNIFNPQSAPIVAAGADSGLSGLFGGFSQYDLGPQSNEQDQPSNGLMGMFNPISSAEAVASPVATHKATSPVQGATVVRSEPITAAGATEPAFKMLGIEDIKPLPTGVTPEDLVRYTAGSDNRNTTNTSGIGIGGSPLIKAHTENLNKYLADPKEVAKTPAQFSAEFRKDLADSGYQSNEDIEKAFDEARTTKANETKAGEDRFTTAMAFFKGAQKAGETGQAGSQFSKFLNGAAAAGENAALGLHHNLVIHQAALDGIAKDQVAAMKADNMFNAGLVRDATMLGREALRDAVANNHWKEEAARAADRLATEVAIHEATIKSQYGIQALSSAATERIYSRDKGMPAAVLNYENALKNYQLTGDPKILTVLPYLKSVSDLATQATPKYAGQVAAPLINYGPKAAMADIAALRGYYSTIDGIKDERILDDPLKIGTPEYIAAQNRYFNWRKQYYQTP